MVSVSRPCSQLPFNYQDRVACLKSRVQDLERRMGLENRVTLAITSFNKSPAAVQQKNVIRLPSWFLLRYEDIPPHLHVQDVNDPRLSDPHFLNQVADWMNRTLGSMGVSTISRPMSLGCLQIFLKLLRDPDSYEKCKDFTIGHELGHLKYSQSARKEYQLHQGINAVSVGGVVVGLLVLILTTNFLLPVVHVTLTIGVSCLAIAISIGGVVAWVNKPARSHNLSAIEEEKKADLDAAKMLGDASGAIYFFETHLRHNLHLRDRNVVSSSSVDRLGNNLNDKNHPPLSGRISYLRDWQSKHC